MMSELDLPKYIYLKSLTKWVNSKITIKHGGEQQVAIENIIQRMSEGSFLMLLINALHNTPIPLQYNAYSDAKLTLEQKIKNAELCFKMLEDSDVEILPKYLNAEKIAKGDSSAITDLIWEIAYKFQVAQIRYKNKEGPDAILSWCSDKIKSKITNFSTDWRNGINYCKLVKAFRPSLINLNEILSLETDKMLDKCFTIIEDRLELIPLLDDEDICELVGEPTTYEVKAVMLFLSDLFHLFSCSEIKIYEIMQSSPESTTWDKPMSISGRKDLFIEWDSDKPALQHVETETDFDLVPDLEMEFESFMEEMLSRAWPKGKFLPLHIVEACSFQVNKDVIHREVFIYEKRKSQNSDIKKEKEDKDKEEKEEGESDSSDEKDLEEGDDEVILVGFCCEEHGSRSASNERHRTYLQFLASTCLEDKDTRRMHPTLPEAALVSYARWLELTYKSSYLHIWVEPPDYECPEYIFRGCSQNVAIPWCKKDPVAERSKLMKTYQHIFNDWNLQGYTWRPEIQLPPAFEKDIKSEVNFYDGINVRKELDALISTARQLSTRLNKFFGERTLVVYLSEVTILAKDLKDSEHLLVHDYGDTQSLIEVDINDITKLNPAPFPPELRINNLLENEELSFAKKDGRYVQSSKKIIEWVRKFMTFGEDDPVTRYEHQRAAGLFDVYEE